jgi:hypothetical protein
MKKNKIPKTVAECDSYKYCDDCPKNDYRDVHCEHRAKLIEKDMDFHKI